MGNKLQRHTRRKVAIGTKSLICSEKQKAHKFYLIFVNEAQQNAAQSSRRMKYNSSKKNRPLFNISVAPRNTRYLLCESVKLFCILDRETVFNRVHRIMIFKKIARRRHAWSNVDDTTNAAAGDIVEYYSSKNKSHLNRYSLTPTRVSNIAHNTQTAIDRADWMTDSKANGCTWLGFSWNKWAPLYELNRRTDLRNRRNMFSVSTAPALQPNFLNSYYDVPSFVGLFRSGRAREMQNSRRKIPLTAW